MRVDKVARDERMESQAGHFMSRRNDAKKVKLEGR